MANWLSTAAGVFQRTPAVEPQTYELRCSCGRMVGGVRASTYQQVSCPACRQKLFVLPASVYPRPKASRPRASVATKRLATAAAATPGSANAAPVRPSGLPLKSRPARLVTTVRVAALLIVCTAGLVILGISRSRSVQQADADYALAVQRGRDALEKKDLAGAGEEFAKASRALSVLGRDDDAARSTRQLARETAAARNLVEKAPPELLAEALQFRSEDKNGWSDSFRYAYKDSWLVIDADVQVQTVKGVSVLAIDFPMIAPGGMSQGVLALDAPILRNRAAADQPKRMIFAAQLAELKASDPPSPRGWKLTLRPDTAFLWSNPATYAQMTGQPLDEGTRQVLAEQTVALHLPAWPTEAPR